MSITIQREERPGGGDLLGRIYNGLSQNGDGQGCGFTHPLSDRTHSDFRKEFKFVQCRGTPADATTGPSSHRLNVSRISPQCALRNACAALTSPQWGFHYGGLLAQVSGVT